ncbi:hypothetical protein BV898_11241 [Hypsibius exemplaris]|uniref:G-protein coupled receptors family 1 profile domain-containing protein n=1 Tax=Hypsibius exemplaris TaxID=2072580 RepID=A0A1W0WH46_HYPEX|nr:hypothetical protein BV898_11241 [Hypsibius exemplaris]
MIDHPSVPDNFTESHILLKQKPNISDIHLYLWVSLMLLIFACGTFGNALTIVAIFSTKKLQTHSNLLVMNMAVIDLLLSGFIYPIKVITMLIHRSGQYEVPENFCRYYGFFSVALTFSSNMTSMAISINRFIAIVYARKYYTFQKLPVLLLMVLVPWIVPPAISSLGLMNRFADNSFLLTELGFCTFNLDLYSTSEGIMSDNWKFLIAMAVPGLFIPTVAIAVSYLAIYIKVWLVRRNLRRSAYSPIVMNMENDVVSAANCTQTPTVICIRMKRFEHRVKGARMMFICFTAFCVTYYPAAIVIMVAGHMRSQILLEKPPLLLWFFGLYFTGCCVNPIIYAWMNVDFRKAFKAIICSCGHKAQEAVQFSLTCTCSSVRRLSKKASCTSKGMTTYPGTPTEIHDEKNIAIILPENQPDDLSFDGEPHMEGADD